MKTKNKGDNLLFFTIIGIMIIANFPELLLLLIPLGFGYFIFLGAKQNSGKTNIKASGLLVDLFKKYEESLKKENSEFFKEIKKETKQQVNTYKIEEEILESLLINKRFPNEKLLQNKIEDIFLQYNLQKDFDTRQNIIKGSYEKFAKIEKEEKIREIESRKKPKKFEYNKNKSYSPKNISKKSKTTYITSSIWDNYESVIDIMERDKK